MSLSSPSGGGGANGLNAQGGWGWGVEREVGRVGVFAGVGMCRGSVRSGCGCRVQVYEYIVLLGACSFLGTGMLWK